jgi:homocysteine S-methyltransferase
VVAVVAAGAEFAVTQLVFDGAGFAAAVGAAREAGVRVPIFAGVLPLLSYRNAAFLHNEMPGCQLPGGVLERMARCGEDRQQARQEGLAIAREIVEGIWEHADGICIVPPLSRYELAAELADFVVSHTAQQR